MYIITVLVGLQGYAQDLPKGFRAQAQIEYNSISEEEKNNELKQSFEEYYTSRKEEFVKKQEFYKSIISSRSVNNLCDNGTFETGIIPNDWNFYWEGDSGSWGPITYTNASGSNIMNSGSFNAADHSVSVHHKSVTSGPDPTIPILNRIWNFPTGNTTSVRLGNKGVKFGKESMAKVITVTPTNSLLSFSYAMVVENPGHSQNSDPSFRVNILDASNILINYNSLVNLGGNGINFISSAHPLLKNYNGIQYKDWTCVTVDLSSLIGQTIIIEFENRDCWRGGHWGYSYIDNICIGCEGANGDEGSIKLNQGQSDDCKIPGKICVDYTLPNGSNPSLDIELQIIQNGLVVNTINSPTLTSGNTYCFNLNSSNTNGLNINLQGFDFKIIGKPKLGTFNLTPKIIGNTASGVNQGSNNDYDILCPLNFDCCQTDLEIYGEQDPFSVQNTFINITNLSYADETFTIHKDATVPIKELRVSITDIQFNYNYDQCATCVNNPALWGGIYSSDEYVGNTPNALKQPNTLNLPNFDLLKQLGNDVDNRINNREIIWENPNGAMLKGGDKFKVTYLLPPASEIPCCVASVKICTKISWQDANCNICERFTCSNIDLVEKITSLKLSQKKNDCCSATLTATSDKPAIYQWNTGETTKEITVKQNGTYTITATTGSSSLTQTIMVNDIPTGAFPILDHTSRFDPTGNTPGIHDKFYIVNAAKPVNAPNAYNATKYKLWIFNSWGELIREMKGDNCNGFNNYSIYWDGKDGSGNYVQTDTYEWRFFVQNCSYKNDTQVTFNTLEEYCKRRLFGVCISKDIRRVTKKIVAGHVNVLR